jgi:hypothetical protein
MSPNPFPKSVTGIISRLNIVRLETKPKTKLRNIGRHALDLTQPRNKAENSPAYGAHIKNDNFVFYGTSTGLCLIISLIYHSQAHETVSLE